MLMSDYRENPELDTFEDVGIDDADVEGMDATTRQLAELRMARRDRAEGVGHRGRHVPSFLQSDDDSDTGDVLRRRRRRHYDEVPDEEEADVRVCSPGLATSAARRYQG